MKLKTKIEQILTKNIEVRDNPKKLIRKYFKRFMVLISYPLLLYLNTINK